MSKIIDIRVWSLLLMLFVTGCVKDTIESEQDPDNIGEVVSVELNFKIPAQAKPNVKSLTKGISGDNEFDVMFFDEPQEVSTKSNGATNLYNLWVFQFDATGKKVIAQKVSDAITSINDMAKLSVNLVAANNQTIYIVSLGKLFTNDLSTVTTISQLETQNLNYIIFSGAVYTSIIKSDADIPYAGRVDGVDVLKLDNSGKGLLRFDTPTGFTGGVLVERLVSKVSLKYKFNVSGYKATGVTLRSVPRIVTINPSKYATQSPAFVDLKAEIGSTPDAQGFYTTTWYIAQNRQGEKPLIGTGNDRNIKNAPANATNMELWAQSSSNQNDYVTYSIYVGSNNTSNFDVDANSIYNLITELNLDLSTAINDDRVNKFTLTSDIELYASAKSGTGSKSPSGAQYDLDSHYDFRKLLVSAAGSSVKVEILTTSGAPITNPSDQWLKLSEYSNYTQAFNNDNLVFSTTTTLITPSLLRYYLYADEYVNTTNNKRSLKVRVTVISTNGGSETKVDFTLSQRPMINLGRWGGPLGSNLQYTTLLVADQMDENLTIYNSEGVQVGNTLRYGYANVNTTAYYNSNNRDNGKVATKALAENKSKLNGGSNGTLYQYNYYNAYAARFCYDRNRDNNGNGKIDDDEMKWYLPAQRQLMAFYVQSGVNRSPFAAGRSVCTFDLGINSIIFLDMNNGHSLQDGKTKGLNVRCIRDI